MAWHLNRKTPIPVPLDEQSRTGEPGVLPRLPYWQRKCSWKGSVFEQVRGPHLSGFQIVKELVVSGQLPQALSKEEENKVSDIWQQWGPVGEM